MRGRPSEPSGLSGKASQAARFTSGFGEPTWRKKFVHEGFRVIAEDLKLARWWNPPDLETLWGSLA